MVRLWAVSCSCSLFCVAFGGIKGLLLWGTKGEYLIWEISEGNIWMEGWERTETKVQKSSYTELFLKIKAERFGFSILS